MALKGIYESVRRDVDNPDATEGHLSFDEYKERRAHPLSRFRSGTGWRWRRIATFLAISLLLLGLAAWWDYSASQGWLFWTVLAANLLAAQLLRRRRNVPDPAHRKEEYYP